MTTPRTVAGQAALSGMRPHVKRALAQTILTIEAEAIAPYLEALREADRVLESLAAQDATSTWDVPSRVDLVKRAEAAHRLVKPLLAEHANPTRL
jgi:hypothetical protein